MDSQLLNLHYLPPRYRVKLLSALYDFIVLDDDVEDDSMKTRIRMTYNLLNGVSKLRFLNLVIRDILQHISKHTRSYTRLLGYYAMLPVARFEK